MNSILLPVSNRYNKKTQNERYQFRRQVRNLIKWYSYISQILRMFDKELQKEYVFCSYLIGLLPKDSVELIDLEGKLKLEYFKLQKTFQGEIALDEAKTVYVPAKHKGVKGMDEKTPLDEVIAKINEKFKGNFTEGDKVILSALRDKLFSDKKLKKWRSPLIRRFLWKVFFLKRLVQQRRMDIWRRRSHIRVCLKIRLNIMRL